LQGAFRPSALIRCRSSSHDAWPYMQHSRYEIEPIRRDFFPPPSHLLSTLILYGHASMDISFPCSSLGTGILYSAQSFAVQASASNSDLSFAAAMYSFFHSLGQTFCVTSGDAIFQNAFKHKLSLNPVLSVKSSQWARDASAIVQIVKSLPDSNKFKGEIVAAYVDSFRMI
jgi:hypothetical protein